MTLTICIGKREKKTTSTAQQSESGGLALQESSTNSDAPPKTNVSETHQKDYTSLEVPLEKNGAGMEQKKDTFLAAPSEANDVATNQKEDMSPEVSSSTKDAAKDPKDEPSTVPSNADGKTTNRTNASDASVSVSPKPDDTATTPKDHTPLEVPLKTHGLAKNQKDIALSPAPSTTNSVATDSKDDSPQKSLPSKKVDVLATNLNDDLSTSAPSKTDGVVVDSKDGAHLAAPSTANTVSKNSKEDTASPASLKTDGVATTNLSDDAPSETKAGVTMNTKDLDEAPSTAPLEINRAVEDPKDEPISANISKARVAAILKNVTPSDAPSLLKSNGEATVTTATKNGFNSQVPCTTSTTRRFPALGPQKIMSAEWWERFWDRSSIYSNTLTTAKKTKTTPISETIVSTKETTTVRNTFFKETLSSIGSADDHVSTTEISIENRSIADSETTQCTLMVEKKSVLLDQDTESTTEKQSTTAKKILVEKARSALRSSQSESEIDVERLPWYPPDEKDNTRTIFEKLFTTGEGKILVENPLDPFDVFPRTEKTPPEAFVCEKCKGTVSSIDFVTERYQDKEYKRRACFCLGECEEDIGYLTADQIRMRFPFYFISDFNEVMKVLEANTTPEQLAWIMEF